MIKEVIEVPYKRIKKKRSGTKFCPHCGTRWERYYSPESLAKILDCSVDKVRKMIQRREIAYRKIGRLVRIPNSELEHIGVYVQSIND